jgi:hypothetical protein
MMPMFSTKDIKRHWMKLNHKYSGREEDAEYKTFLNKDWFGRLEMFAFIDRQIAEGYAEGKTDKVIALQGLKNQLLGEIRTQKEIKRDG